jgi:uracil-DNA glycosylase
LGVDEEQFYNEELFSLMPMGFCYPGKGTSGDLPPRPECAPQWHPSLWARLREVRLTVLIGAYAQAHYLGAGAKASLTGTVQSYAAYLPRYFPLPHPSPRNRPWQSKHPWFPQTVLPALQKQVRAALA